jgi:hypothetical protein
MAQPKHGSYANPLFADANIPHLVMAEITLTSLTSSTQAALKFPEATTITGMGIIITTQTNGGSELSILDAADAEKMLLTIPTGKVVGEMVNSLKDNSVTTVNLADASAFYEVAANTAFKIKVKSVAATAGKGYVVLYIRPTNK